MADAADSLHGQRQADGAGVADRALDIPPERTCAKNKIVPIFSPRRPEPDLAPGTGGGTNYSPLSYSPQTGLLYVNAIDQPFNNGGRGPKGYFSAYDPTTGELKWRKIFEGFGQAGSVVTAGGVVFVGTGSNIAGLLLRVRREDRRPALEVQHRIRRLLVAVGLHRERRAVRHGRVWRRRPRTARRRSDPELRVAAAIEAMVGADPCVGAGADTRSRRRPMKRFVHAGTVVASLSGLLSAQAPPGHEDHAPRILWTSCRFLKLPEGMNFGEVPGVAVNSKGHVFIFTRLNSAYRRANGATAAQSCSSSARGEFLREVGKQLYGWSFAHSVRVDKDDNVWAIDKGSDMVIKFNPAGRVQWVFGRRQESADEAKPWEHVDLCFGARRPVSPAD